MMRIFPIVAVLVGSCMASYGQLATSLSLNKKNYVAGEPVIAEVIITNHSGQDLTLSSTRELPWLAFVVTNSRGNPVTTRKLNAFGALKIKVGESLAKRVDLSEYFMLSSQGNFAASAVIRDPHGKVNGSSTNRLLFNLNPGRTYWTQKVGVKNDRGAETREMRLITFSNGQKTQLYAQVTDGHTGVPMRTFLLGDAMMLRKPMVTLDSAQRMHVMFLATPSMWVHCQVSADGKLVDRDIHQRASQGDPVLMAYGDGSVRVVNSIPYDPEAVKKEQSTIRKASDRPQIPAQ
ncbi:hypothetical protein ACFSSA_00650 [Luteolibacter algae]|uniref:Uncharacterized protein n=1 Tax=Luteolibacter algae TaxID=454151 RepID=A0ABW5D356_9BACT